MIKLRLYVIVAMLVVPGILLSLSCQNPNDGSEPSAPAKVAHTTCGGCMIKSCISACPNGAISYSDRIVIDPEKCDGCGECISNCVNEDPRITLIDR